MTDLRADRDTILQAFDLFVAAGDVVELRAPLRRGRTMAGYFDDRERFAAAALQLSGKVSGVYFTLNPVNPALAARIYNRVEDYAANLTHDQDIVCRRRIPFDLDATRPAGISSTDVERDLALAAADRVVAFLIDHGVPRDSLLDGTSGNGAHVHLAVELPNDPAATTLVQDVLAVVAAHVDTEQVHLDQTMFNASRIIKLPGTRAQKGDSTAARPHGLATFRTIPAPWVPVETVVLQAIAALKPAPRGGTGSTPGAGPRGSFDVRAFLSNHGVTITSEKEWKGSQGDGTFLELAACVFDPSHDRGEAGVIALAKGMLLYSCRHDSCRTKRWDDIRWTLDPRHAHARQRAYDAPAPPEWEPGLDEDEPRRSANPWTRAISAAALLDEADTVLDWLEPRLLSPEAITQWYSPRGLGKTQVALAIAVKLARAGHHVLLLDRDNPRREIKRRLRAWGAEGLATLDVMTRDDVPHLLDRAAWQRFPKGKYELVIVDSWDATSEGIGEQDSAKPSQAIATLNDLAHVANGPAILVLGNTVKTGSHGRGSGVVEDRGDIVYEVRDATDVKPSGTRPWCTELPPAGREGWVDRAGRRTRRERDRLAFINTKFRLGEGPDPFVLEVDFTTVPWSLRDVTPDLVAAGEAAMAEAKEQAATIRAAAVAALRAEVEARGAAKEPPYTKERAVTFLTYNKLKRDQARSALEEEDGRSWRLRLGGKRGNALLVVPLGTETETPPRETPTSTPTMPPSPEPHVGQNGGDDQEPPRENTLPEVLAAHGVADETFSRTTLAADREKRPSGSACAAGGSEEAFSRGGSPRKPPSARNRRRPPSPRSRPVS
jgi:AAA domain